jgi:predicted acetyltransferase
VIGMAFEFRPLAPEYVPAFRQTLSLAFGGDVDLDDEAMAERFTALFVPERAFPLFDGDELISTGADFEFQLTVPGGAQVATSGLTVVSVRPTHTRQGVLTAMMREHFRRARDRNEILGALWASEASIYGRFGYGPAVQHHEIEFDVRHVGSCDREPGIEVHLVDQDQAEKLLPDVYAGVQVRRPGMFRRTPNWWKYRLFYDPEKWRNGASAVRHAVAFAEGEPVGYVSYRQKEKWDQMSKGEVRVRELIPATDVGYRALWHYLSNIDLFPIVKHWNMAPDDPLWLLFPNGRAVGTTAVADGIWVRLIDVKRALEARTYAYDGAMVIGVSDPFCDWNDGNYLISIDGGRANVVRVHDDADVNMTASTLGALYLGGRDALAFARAGRIDGSPEAVQTLNLLVRSSPEPWCPEIF